LTFSAWGWLLVLRSKNNHCRSFIILLPATCSVQINKPAGVHTEKHWIPGFAGIIGLWSAGPSVHCCLLGWWMELINIQGFLLSHGLCGYFVIQWRSGKSRWLSHPVCGTSLPSQGWLNVFGFYLPETFYWSQTHHLSRQQKDKVGTVWADELSGGWVMDVWMDIWLNWKDIFASIKCQYEAFLILLVKS